MGAGGQLSHERYNGPDYDPERDNRRLDKQIDRVRNLMLDGRWRSLEEVSQTTGDPAASVSAQLRHLRKDRFGSYILERKNVGNGLNLYRLLPPDPDPQSALF